MKTLKRSLRLARDKYQRAADSAREPDAAKPLPCGSALRVSVHRHRCVGQCLHSHSRQPASSSLRGRIMLRRRPLHPLTETGLACWPASSSGQSSGSVDNINSKKSRPNGTSLEAAALDLLKQANSNISKDAVCNIHGNASNRRFACVRRAPCASGTKSVISVFFLRFRRIQSNSHQ